LTVLSVVEPLLAEAAKNRFGHDVATSDTEQALQKLVAAARPQRGASALQTTLRVRVGNPADVIVETARTDAVDLIVMGTQGLRGLMKWVMGSTTERVLRHTPRPVLAVPWTVNEASVTRLADVPIDLGRILIATDFSEASLIAATFAVRLAQHFSVPLSFAHIIESPIVMSRWRELMEESGQERVTQARLALTHLAEQFADSRDYETIAVAGRPSDVIGSVAADRGATLIVMGLADDQGRLAPPEAIVEYAMRQAGDLLVVGTHGYGPVKRFLLGHVADRVIRQARCPVLTIPHDSLQRADQQPFP
jgi:nucleotide-binding universal stress UspA family protein